MAALVCLAGDLTGHVNRRLEEKKKPASLRRKDWRMNGFTWQNKPPGLRRENGHDGERLQWISGEGEVKMKGNLSGLK